MKQHPLADWNVEIAHVTWSAPGANESISESLAIADGYIADFRRENRTFVVCSLIDDKESKISDRSIWLRQTARDYPKLFGLLDYICFESDLIVLKNEFLQQIKMRERARIDREIERYRRKHGQVACSQDIAVWHALRLGMLPSGRTVVHGVTNPKRTNRRSGVGFAAKRLLSVLEEDDREAEERANREILKYCDATDVVDRIELRYYPTP